MTEEKDQVAEIPDPITADQFDAIEADLAAQLSDRLQEELDMLAFEITDESNDLYEDLPAVDSKAVVKLSPIVEKMTGRKIDVKWIKKGGYDSKDEALSDLLAKIRNSCEGS